jgi:LmbE family N-acetylglucosaminyl deacetylase
VAADAGSANFGTADLLMENIEGWTGKKNILVILAHPDDPEFFCGAMIARWCAAGHSVNYCLLTKGQRGAEDEKITIAEIEQKRIAEQNAAARLLGVSSVLFLDYMDGDLVPDLKLRQNIVKVIRKFKPEIIVTSDPQNLFPTDYRINHPDHRAAGQAVVDAVFPAAGNPRVLAEEDGKPLSPHQVEEVWLAQTHQSNLSVELTKYFETKMNAIACHVSQLKEPIDQFREKMRSRWESDPDSGQLRYVEKFKRIQFQNK